MVIFSLWCIGENGKGCPWGSAIRTLEDFYELLLYACEVMHLFNISGQMDLIFWHSLHLHPAHFFIFQGCFSLRPSDHLIVLGFEPGVGPGTVPPQPCFFLRAVCNMAMVQHL